MQLSLIAAYGKNKEIGYEGSLPWKLPTDLAHFKSLTTGQTVMMGRKTYESIGRPLPNRTNIVLTSKFDYAPAGVLVANSWETGLDLIPPLEPEAFVIGGSQISAMALTRVTKMYITEVDYSGSADAYFPDFNSSDWNLTSV